MVSFALALMKNAFNEKQTCMYYSLDVIIHQVAFLSWGFQHSFLSSLIQILLEMAERPQLGYKINRC